MDPSGLFLHERLSYDYRNDDHRVGAAAVFYLEIGRALGKTVRERMMALIGSF